MAWKEKHDGYVEIYIKRWKYWKRCDRETKSHQKRFYHERGRSRLLSLTGCGWKLVSGMDWAGEWCGALLDLYSFKHWSPGRHSPRWESCQSWNPEWVAVSKSHNLDLHPPIFHPIRSSSPTLCLKRILPSLMSCWLNSLTFIEIMIIILPTKITIINNHNNKHHSSILNSPFYWGPQCTQAPRWEWLSTQTWCPPASCRCPCPRIIGPSLKEEIMNYDFFMFLNTSEYSLASLHYMEHLVNSSCRRLVIPGINFLSQLAGFFVLFLSKMSFQKSSSLAPKDFYIIILWNDLLIVISIFITSSSSNWVV